MGDKIHRNSLKPGHKLHWYRIEKILGQGGFGITYLAHDFNLDRQVAIKEYLPIELAVRERDFSAHPVTEEHGEKFRWGRDRFITEARTLAKFKHPNIVQVLNVFEENNTAYMVMEYEHGESLQDLLSRRKTIEEAKLINILIPVLGGLQKVHEAGFIHRDIKPANIFIRKDGSPVLLDFGSARQALGVATQTLTSLVSPGYAPYEQYYSKSNQQGPWTDIYGLGATLYRAVAGMAPMDAVDRSRAILKGDRDIFVSAKEIGKGRYSERFLLAIDHALKFKEEDRPQTISAWKSEFDLPEDPIKKAIIAERISTWPGTKALGKRQQNVWLSGKVALLGLLISVAIVYFYRDEIQHYLGPTKTQLEVERQLAEEEKRLAVLKQKEEESLRRKEEEQKRTGAEAQRQAESERQRVDDEKNRLAEEEARQKFENERLNKERIQKQYEDGIAAHKSGNYQEALSLFMPLADQGYAEAQYSLGLMYYDGEGVPQDAKQAAHWFQKAAEQRIAGAQLRLGHIYAYGLGVLQDDKQAVYWYQKAAEQGGTVAQFFLGAMYESGRGVPQDAKQAVYWFQKAAKKGDAFAQYRLGHMYHDGEGVPQDDIQAVHWIQKAADQGNDDAKKFLSEHKQ